MNNKEAYRNDLEELEAAIASLLRAVPTGNTRRASEAKGEAERIAGAARATIACMKNDYIPVEFD